MDPIIGASLISAGSGILSGIFGGASSSYQADQMLKATRETNAQNYKIWQEQKAHNIDMFNLQNKANIDMWNMQNAYNDPSAVMQRWLDAGVSPYMALGQMGGAGVASSAPQSATMAQAQAPTMQAPPSEAFTSPILVGLQQGFQSAMQVVDAYSSLINSENTKADTLLKGQQFDYNEKSMPLAIRSLQLDNDNKFMSGQILGLEKQYLDSTMSARQEAVTLANDNLRAAIRYQNLKADEQQVINKYLDAKEYVELCNMCQTYANAVLDGNLKIEQAKNLVAQRAVYYADAKLKEQDYNLRKPAENMALATDDAMKGDVTIGGDKFKGSELLSKIAVNLFLSDFYNSSDKKIYSQWQEDTRRIGFNKWSSLSDSEKEFNATIGSIFGDTAPGDVMLNWYKETHKK